jgi:hypothetical protein
MILMKTFDLAVVGCGSGGFGAALAAARAGLAVVVVEKSDQIGGNANRCGVNNWESVAGATGFPFEIYTRLKAIPDGVGIYGYSRHFLWSGRDTFPGGEHTVEAARGKEYRDTLVRHTAGSIADNEQFIRNNIFGVVFEPGAYEQTLRRMLDETGRCSLISNTAFTGVQGANGRVVSITLENGDEIRASYFVDGTGDGDLCAAAGCETMTGQEPRSRFGEPSAPEDANNRINGASLIFRITRRDTPQIDPLPEGIPDRCWWQANYPFAAFFQFPNGDYNVNTLPTMEGREYLDADPARAYEECRKRVLSWWHHVQNRYPEMRSYTVHSMSPAVGVRESKRIVGEYILTQADCTGGVDKEKHPDIIALADHQLDRHGGDAMHTEIPGPYGIPYRCLIPRGFSNLLIACRAASFSSIAATSCRLSRTMMQLGQAAGTAAALAIEGKLDLRDVPPAALIEALVKQHVQLNWPMEPELQERLGED